MKGPSADEMARLRAVLGFNDVKVLAHGWGDGAIVIAVTEGLVVLTDEVDSAVAWHEIVRGMWNGRYDPDHARNTYAPDLDPRQQHDCRHP